MADDSEDPSEVTIRDVFRVVNQLRREQSSMRQEQSSMRQEQSLMRQEMTEFRASVESRLDDMNLRLEGQTENALNLALNVLGDQRSKLKELIAWANTQGADIGELR